jgi:hypothetical protein
LTDSPLALPVSKGPCGVPDSPSPTTFAVGSSSLKLCLPFRVLQSAPAHHLPMTSTFHGVPSPFTTSTNGVHSREHPKLASFRPQSFSLSRRVSPPLALQVYFTLQPCLGSLFRGFPSHLAAPLRQWHFALMLFDCSSCLQLAPKAPRLQPHLQGLAPSGSPLLRTQGVSLRPNPIPS